MERERGKRESKKEQKEEWTCKLYLPAADGHHNRRDEVHGDAEDGQGRGGPRQGRGGPGDRQPDRDDPAEDLQRYARHVREGRGERVREKREEKLRERDKRERKEREERGQSVG